MRLGGYESGIAGFVCAGRPGAAPATACALGSRAYVPAECVAAIYAALRDRDRALSCLERAIAAWGLGLIFLEAEPMYASPRGEPGYRRVVEHIGLVRR